MTNVSVYFALYEPSSQKHNKMTTY